MKAHFKSGPDGKTLERRTSFYTHTYSSAKVYYFILYQLTLLNKAYLLLYTDTAIQGLLFPNGVLPSSFSKHYSTSTIEASALIIIYYLLFQCTELHVLGNLKH